MCGICGATGRLEPEALRAMTVALTHRGPDDEGYFDAPGIALGVRRLSIIDLPSGHQPIANEDGSVVVAYNGEIYNYRQLRDRLAGQGHHLRTASDTEVLVHLYEEHGDALVDHLQGMFAFALWDARRQRLLLARDRLGIKPLYYAATQHGLVFASEAKALFHHPAVRPEANLDVLDSYLSLRYVPGPDTMFRGVKKLQPAHTAVFANGRLTLRRYWDLPEGEDPRMTLGQATEAFQALLADAVRAHLVSDVPVGILLSGGLDSSTIAAFTSATTATPFATFTVGFDLPGAHNELAAARATATHLGADHHELVVAPDAAALLPTIARHLDEPLGDPAALPTYLICRFARESVPVVLTGEGADELLAGYPRYTWFARAGMLQRRVPRRLRAVALALTRPLPLPPRYHAALDNLLAQRGDAERHLHWVAGVSPELKAELALRRPLPAPRSQTGGSGEGGAVEVEHVLAAGPGDVIRRLMRLDLTTWLVDDVLTKMDRMSMAVSVEARVPLLDHRLVEFAARLPVALHLAQGPKTLLRRVAAPLLPPPTIRRRKHAFQIPLRQWLEGPLHDFVGDTLLDKTARERGWIDTTRLASMLPVATATLQPSRGLRPRHAARRIDPQSLWTLLALELWAREYL